MMIDSTLLIDVLKGDTRAIAIMQGSKGNALFTTEVNIFELATGILRDKKNPSKSLALVDIMLRNVQVIDLTRNGAVKAAEVHAHLLNQGTPVQPTDCLIAGIALSNGINSIITRNKADFDRIPGMTVVAY